MAKIAMMVLCAMVICLVVSAPYAEALSCLKVYFKFVPCIGYLIKGGVVPSACCDGVKGVNNAANTTLDRQAACSCLKSAADSIKGINPDNAASLPDKCGVDIPYEIGPNTNCTKVQ